jgi:hypothetical protein
VPLKAGDRVRTEAGTNGKIVTLSADGVTAYVMLTKVARGAHVFACLIASLTKSDDDPAPATSG